MNGLIYKAISPSEKYYIGQTIDLQDRQWKHKSSAFRIKDKSYNYPFHAALRKYGFESFKWEIILDNLPSKAHMDMWERLYIHLENSTDRNFGYNLTFGGDHTPMLGRNHSTESKQKISNALKGRPVWNKGLTKEDSRVAKYVEGGKKTQFGANQEINFERCSKAGKLNKGVKKPQRSEEHIKNLVLAGKRLRWVIRPQENISKRIDMSDLETYLSKGYVQGRIKV